MSNVWCVRAEFGKYAEAFVKNGYVAIGWLDRIDLGLVKSKDELYPLYREAYPNDTSNVVVGQQVGQISRFLFELKEGDYVITPSSNTEQLYYGIIETENSYFYQIESDECPYRHRRKVSWFKDALLRSGFSVPFQNTIRSSLTVFSISHRDEFLESIGQGDAAVTKTVHDSYRVVLEQILRLDPSEFEILVGHLLTALGFDGTKVTGKVGDGGVDVIGELDVYNLAKVKLFVQAKRYRLDAKIKSSIVKALRSAIPKDGQGAFITTADYDKKSNEIAMDPNFPRIGLINGKKLVDLLISHWDNIPVEFQERLGLEPGLVLK